MHSALRAPGRRTSNRFSLPSRQWLTLLWVCGEMTLHLKIRCLVPEQMVHASQGWQVGRLRVTGGCGSRWHVARVARTGRFAVDG